MSNCLKRFCLLAIIAITTGSLFGSAFAQNDSEMEFFEGGYIRSEFGIRSQLLTGTGVKGAYGGLIAPISPDPFVIFGNPAAISRIKGRKVVVASSPSLEFDLASISDPNPSIKEEMDVRLESFNVTGTKTYPEMTGSIGLLGSFVSGFALTLPIESNDDRWLDGKLPRLFDCIAFGYTEPFRFRSNFTYSGLRMRIRTIDRDVNGVRVPENEVLLYSSIKMDSDISVTSDSWNISVARETGDFWLGAGIQRTAGRIEIHTNQRTDGIMSKAGSESSFNDPQSPWDDDYFFTAHGLFQGSALALRLGSIYQPSPKVILGAMFRLQGKMKMDADFDLELHSFTALKMNAAEGEKRFDINKIEDASELTRTTEKVFETASTMDVSIPSELAVSASYDGLIKPSITFTKYFGELSYRYEQTEDGVPFVYRRGYKPDYGMNLNFDLFVLKFGIGAVKAVDVVEGYKDSQGTPIPPASAIWIPHLSFGFETGLSDALKLGVLLEGLPEDAVRLTLEYSL